MRLALASVVSGAVICAALSAAGQAATPQPILVEISTNHTVVKAGSPVIINLKLTNLSQKSLDTSANMNRQTGLDPNFKIKVLGPTGNLAGRKIHKHPELAAGQAFPNRGLKSGETLKENFDLSRAYNIASPGKYVIQVSREIPKDLGGGVAKSNKITVTLIP